MTADSPRTAPAVASSAAASADSISDSERTDRLFRALASAPRREILRMLATGDGAEPGSCCGQHDVCACTFSERLGLGAPTVSHHMRVLKEAGLVVGEKRGLWVYYRLEPDAMTDALRLVVDSLQLTVAGS